MVVPEELVRLEHGVHFHVQRGEGREEAVVQMKLGDCVVLGRDAVEGPVLEAERLHGVQPRERATLELDHLMVVRGGTLREDEDGRAAGALVLRLTLFNLLGHPDFLFFAAGSVQEHAVNGGSDDADSWDVLHAPFGEEAGSEIRQGHHDVHPANMVGHHRARPRPSRLPIGSQELLIPTVLNILNINPKKPGSESVEPTANKSHALYQETAYFPNFGVINVDSDHTDEHPRSVKDRVDYHGEAPWPNSHVHWETSDNTPVLYIISTKWPIILQKERIPVILEVSL